MIRENTKDLFKKKYATLLDMTQTGVYEIDIASSSGYVSGFLNEIFNTDEDSTFHINEYFLYIPQPYRKQVQRELKEALEASGNINLNIPIENSDKLLWVTIKGQKIDDNTYYLLHFLSSEEPVIYDVDISSGLQHTLDLIPVPLMIIRDDEKIIYFNAAFTQATGYSHQDVPTVKEWVQKAFGDEHQEIYKIILKQFDLKNRVDKGQFQFESKSGVNKVFHFFTTPLGNDKKGRKQILSIGTDISESFHKDRLINQQHEELTILHEKLPYLLVTADPEGNILYANENSVKYSGYTIRQIKEGWVDLVHPDDQRKVLRTRDESVATGKTFNADFRLKRHDNIFHWFNFKFLPVKDHSDNIIKWIGAGIDIHEQYISQQQLTESLKTEVSHLNEIIEYLPQLAWTADAQGNIDYFNKRWYQYTRQSPDKSLGLGWNKILHPEDSEKNKELLSMGIKKDQEIDFEARFLNGNDHKYYWHLIHTLPVKSKAGNIKYWVGTATNIHEQKMLEYNKGEFLNVASHELRTPLTTLMGYLQLMEMSAENDDFSNQKLYIQKSINSTKRINRLINDLLNLNIVESGKIANFQREEINVGELLKEITENYRQLYPGRELRLNIEDKDIMASGNAFRLEQVIDNLISNGLKYAPSSPIIINLKKYKGDMLMIEVSDFGKGIPQDKLSAVFDRFYRINDSAVSSGLGVGLFISREIIKQHNGEIWAERNEEKGTTFRFVIPAA